MISPAFRWAQSLQDIFIEVKWATRFDSPACLETYDHQHKLLDSKTLLVEAMCKNDIKVLHYRLEVQLSDSVLEDSAKFEVQSVGRLAITLKKGQAAKWEQLVQGVKPGNMVVWWDLVEKYEKELESAGESQEGTAS